VKNSELMQKRLFIFTGGLGSGKTELAINTALALRARGPVALVDLDIVNPYFRTRKARDALAALGIEVVCGPGALAEADTPVLVPAIMRVLTSGDCLGVLDVGGDDVGAVVLGSFRPYLPEAEAAILFVVNVCRPRTQTAAGVVRLVRAIERTARVRVDYLVNNTNFGPRTDAALVASGQAVVQEAAAALGIEVAFASIRRDLAAEARQLVYPVPVMPLDLYMRVPWMEED